MQIVCGAKKTGSSSPLIDMLPLACVHEADQRISTRRRAFKSPRERKREESGRTRTICGNEWRQEWNKRKSTVRVDVEIVNYVLNECTQFIHGNYYSTCLIPFILLVFFALALLIVDGRQEVRAYTHTSPRWLADSVRPIVSIKKEI